MLLGVPSVVWYWSIRENEQLNLRGVTFFFFENCLFLCKWETGEKVKQSTWWNMGREGLLYHFLLEKGIELLSTRNALVSLYPQIFLVSWVSFLIFADYPFFTQLSTGKVWRLTQVLENFIEFVLCMLWFTVTLSEKISSVCFRVG